MSIYGSAIDGIKDYTRYASQRTQQAADLVKPLTGGSGPVQGSEDYPELTFRLNRISNDLEYAQGILNVIVKNIVQLQI